MKKISPNILILTIAFILPVVAIIFTAFSGDSTGELSHLAATVLPSYITTTVILILGVGGVTLLIGTITAWLTVAFEFTGRKFFSWGLIFPLAIPAYISAFIYAGTFEYAGNVQSSLRGIFSWSKSDYYFPEIRSVYGAIIIFSFVLYPYVYLLSRWTFLRAGGAVRVGRTLGMSMSEIFCKIILPSSRPAIIAGVALACMEVLSDFGAVDILAVDTFTTGIYRSWYGMNSHAAAAKLSLFLLIFVLTLLYLEYRSRKGRGYVDISTLSNGIDRVKLSGRKNILAFILCATIFIIGFAFPILQLIIWTFETFSKNVDGRFLSLIFNTISVSMISALIAVIIAVFFAYYLRFDKSKANHRMIRISSLGYAIPGSIAAIGIIIGFGYFDKILDNQFSTGLLLSGTIIALIFAYIFRFLAVAIGATESGMNKVTNEIEWYAKLSGLSGLQKANKLYFPILKGSIFTAFLLVFVEAVKELPATLIIRPFNFDTLATRTYEYASDQLLADSASSALMIVIIGIIPVALLSLRGITPK